MSYGGDDAGIAASLVAWLLVACGLGIISMRDIPLSVMLPYILRVRRSGRLLAHDLSWRRSGRWMMLWPSISWQSADYYNTTRTTFQAYPEFLIDD